MKLCGDLQPLLLLLCGSMVRLCLLPLLVDCCCLPVPAIIFHHFRCCCHHHHRCHRQKKCPSKIIIIIIVRQANRDGPGPVSSICWWQPRQDDGMTDVQDWRRCRGGIVLPCIPLFSLASHRSPSRRGCPPGKGMLSVQAISSSTETTLYLYESI